MKVIIDTNVFMSGLFWSGIPSKIIDAWQLNTFNLILSTDILDEYMRVAHLLSKKYSLVNIDDLFEQIILKSKVYDSSTLLTPVSRDKDDDKFIACAITSSTKIIVTGDMDLLDVNGFNNINIIKPRQFYDLYLAKK